MRAWITLGLGLVLAAGPLGAEAPRPAPRPAAEGIAIGAAPLPVPRPAPVASLPQNAAPDSASSPDPAPLPAPRPFLLASKSPLPAPRAELYGPAWRRPDARPAPAYGADGVRLRDPAPQCDPSGAYCIRFSHPLADTCGLLEQLSAEHDLPPGFFARLIWRESLFDPYAISPAGALGIAQFMPGTARLRGLADPFNPAAALSASAAYLAELRDRFGSLGMAAVAYNGGEARAERFLAHRGGLPRETRAYVQAITGHSAEAWRRAPALEADLRLDQEQAFLAACLARAQSRNLPQFAVAPALAPWAVIVAAHQDRAVVAKRYRQAAARNPVLQRHEPTITRTKVASMRSSQFTAQIGRPSRLDAARLCDEIRRHGAFCTVLRN